MLAEEWFRFVNSFLGYGDPHGAIWFVGLEEAASLSPNPEDDSGSYTQYSKKHFPVEPGEIRSDAATFRARYTKIYDIMSKIAVSLLHDRIADSDNWKTFRDEILLTNGSDTFQVNLYPLGKKSWKDWPPQYEQLFGSSPEGIQKYYNEVAQKRFPILKAEREKYRPRLTICSGKLAWPIFERLFAGIADSYIFDDCKIFHHGLVLCPFFNPRWMSNDRINALTSRLKDFLIR